MYILVWLLYSAYEFSMLIAVAINSTFRLILHDHTEIFTVASEAAAATLMLLMVVIHYFIVEYYRQLVDFNEKERKGENNRLRQVSAWLRAFPGKHHEDKCSKCDNHDSVSVARRGTATSHITGASRAHFGAILSNINNHSQLSPDSAETTLDGRASPDPTIFDCDEYHQPLSVAEELEEGSLGNENEGEPHLHTPRNLPPIATHAGHAQNIKRREPDAESWE